MNKITAKTIKNIKKGDLIVLKGEGNGNNFVAGIISGLHVYETIFSDLNGRELAKPQNRYAIHINDWGFNRHDSNSFVMNESTLLKRLVNYVPAEMIAA